MIKNYRQRRYLPRRTKQTCTACKQQKLVCDTYQHCDNCIAKHQSSMCPDSEPVSKIEVALISEIKPISPNPSIPSRKRAKPLETEAKPLETEWQPHKSLIWGKNRVTHACLPCQMSHLSCTDTKPCTRCINRGLQHKCIVVPFKREIRKRGRKAKNRFESVIPFTKVAKTVPTKAIKFVPTKEMEFVPTKAVTYVLSRSINYGSNQVQMPFALTNSAYVEPTTIKHITSIGTYVPKQGAFRIVSPTR